MKVPERRIMNFFCVGAQKAGTTTLHNILIQHSDIYLPKEKEARYFDKEDIYNNGIEWYINTFYSNYSGEKICGSITPEYLFKAGEVSIGLKEYDQAAGFFERIYNNYPDYNKRVESLYLVGFVYDEHANNYGKAKEYYEKVVANHPDHGFADDAKASIETLGLTDEEIIKKFEAKQKEMAN